MQDLGEFLERRAAKWAGVEALDAVGGAGTLLVLTCIDLRYPSVILNLMEAKGYHKKYDQVALAGAGLAAVVDFPPHPKPHWQQTFVEHVAISSILHKISAVWVMDHRDCGAYRSFGLLGAEPTDPGQLPEFLAHEKEVHRQKFCKLAGLIRQQFSHLEVEGLLLPKEEEVKATPPSEGQPYKLPKVEFEELTCD